MNIDGLYIHIPFCRHRCGYCDFATWAGKDHWITPYLEALSQEMQRHEGGRPKTVYLGGGTPSVLEPEQWNYLFSSLRKSFDLAGVEEFTAEVNPESVTEKKLAAMSEGGVNRISMGLQSTDNRLLQSLERLHSWEEFLKAYRMVRQGGFENVSIDLMYGLPGQSLELWEKSVEDVLLLDPQHLSCYGLMVEPKTPFYAKGIVVDEELFASMYEWLLQRLEKSPLEHYEISNWAQKGYQSRHNLLYWTGGNVLGFGVSAASYVDGVRWKNTENLQDYLEAIQQQRDPACDRETLQGPAKLGEQLMLKLRLSQGTLLQDQERELFGLQLEQFQQEGLLHDRQGRLCLTDRGYLLSNTVFRALV